MEKKLTKKRELILKESFKLFLSKGYDAVSLTDIERVARVTRGAIFHHFSNKEDLFKHVAEQFILIFLEEEDYGEEYLSSATPLRIFMDKCLVIIGARMNYFLQGVDSDVSPASFMSFILYLKDHYEVWEKKFRIYEEKKIQIWSDVISLSKVRGEIRPDIDSTMLAETLQNLYFGLSYKGAIIDKLSISELRRNWEYIYKLHLVK